MRKITYCLLMLWLFVGTTGCGEFLKESSQSLSYAEKASDLEELLLGSAYLNPIDNHKGFDPQASNGYWGHLMAQSSTYMPWIHIMDDDAAQFVTGVSNATSNKWVMPNTLVAFSWQPQPFLNVDSLPIVDNYWSNTYARIAVTNSVLTQLVVLEPEEQDEFLMKRVEGEAKFLRAFNYFWLINLYAQPYSVQNAETEMGVPLKTNGYIEDKFFERASVKEVYEQIVSDLIGASVCFENLNITAQNRVNYAAINALLSRVYLYMEEYQKAIDAADRAIACEGYGLLNYNNIKMGASVTYLKSPETFFTQGGYIMGVLHTNDVNGPRDQAASYTSSPDLLSSYDEVNDIRINAFFLPSTKTGKSNRCLKLRSIADGVVSDQWLIRLPEVYLNKAEAEAILGKSSATATIDELRVNRIKASGFRPTTATGEELVNFIREERRRELCFEGHRWFDLRRYGVNSRYHFSKKIVHVRNDYASLGYYAVGEYVLNPYPQDKEAYVFPLPGYAILFNEGVLKQNPLRPLRMLNRY